MSTSKLRSAIIVRHRCCRDTDCAQAVDKGHEIVVRPPRERPTVQIFGASFAPVALLKNRTSSPAIKTHPKSVSSQKAFFENLLPSPLRLTPEAHIDGEPIAEVFRQIKPGRLRTPQRNSFDEAPVVTATVTSLIGFARFGTA